MKPRFLIALLLLIPALSPAASLSLDQIVQLHSAGIGDTVIAHQIEADGISFDPNTTALLALRKAGLTDTVLDALVKAGAGTTNTPAAASTLDHASELYKAGKYAEAADQLDTKVKSETVTDRDYAVLVLTLLRIGRTDDAQAQLEHLTSRFPQSGLLSKVKAAVSATTLRHQVLVDVLGALNAGNLDDARDTIRRSLLTEQEKILAGADVESLSGNFDRAEKLLGQLATDSYSISESVKTKLAKIVDSRRRYERSKELAENYLYSPSATIAFFAPSTETPWGNRMTYPEQHQALPAYLNAVKELSETAPYAPHVEDFVFHANLLTGSYEDVSMLGDKLLSERGVVRVPCIAGAFLWLVIDKKDQRIRTELDPHKFLSPTISFWDNGYDEEKSIEGYSVDMARQFLRDYPFSDIKSIGATRGDGTYKFLDQVFPKNPTDFGAALKNEANPLAINGKGFAVMFATQGYIRFKYGTDTVEAIDNNLINFLHHVVGLPVSQQQARDTTGAKAHGSALLHAVGALGTALGSPGATAFNQQLQDQEAASQSQQAAAITLQHSAAIQIYLDDIPDFRDLESMLTLT